MWVCKGCGLQGLDCMCMEFERNLGAAKTEDGYVFYLQPDGSYTDGDMRFSSAANLQEENVVRFIPPEGKSGE